MAFLGVQFDDSSIALVSEEWLTPRKKETFWPQYKHQAEYYKSLKSHESPNDATWKLHSISRIFFQTEDFDKALRKIKEAEETSDLQSEVDELNEAGKKRRRRPVSRKLYDTDDSGDEEQSLFPRPPVLKQAKRVEINASSCSQRENTPEQRELFATPSTSNSLISFGVTGSSTINNQDAGLFKNVLSVLYQIKEQNQIILNHIIKSNTGSSSALPEIPVDLPLKTLEDVESLESHLLDREHLLALSDFLSTVGGKDASSLTNNILRRCLTNQVACFYSFKGKSSKRAFGDLGLRTVVVGAVKKKFPGITERDIEDFIKVWLKHSPQRFKADIAKGRCQPRTKENENLVLDRDKYIEG